MFDSAGVNLDFSGFQIHENLTVRRSVLPKENGEITGWFRMVVWNIFPWLIYG